MGRELILKKLRSRSLVLIILGFFLFLGCGFLAFCCIIGEFIPMVILGGIFALLGLVFIILGFRMRNPEKSTFIKRNPDLLNQADELYSHIVYEDKTIVHSHQHIASKKNPLCIASFEEIIGIYEKTTTYSHVITIEHNLVLVTPKGDNLISIYGKNKEAVAEIVGRIYKYCPNARYGFSVDNMKYFRQMQKAYKKQCKAQKNV